MKNKTTWKITILIIGGFITFIGLFMSVNKSSEHIDGLVWQPDNLYAFNKDIPPVFRHFLIQWTVVDDQSLMTQCGTTPLTKNNSTFIEHIPKSTEIIVGLAGSFNEKYAREHIAYFISQSQCIARFDFPFSVAGWYFPVEIDPTWSDVKSMATLLHQLPKPLWISIYDNSNIGPTALSAWIKTWLPSDVNILFQDGVGLHMRTPDVAMDYLATLQKELGNNRVRLIAEAFRPNTDGHFRPATEDELNQQLSRYPSNTYLFERRYLSDNWVAQYKQSH